jgi:hypothetical protein
LQALEYLFGTLGRAQMPPKQHKKYIFLLFWTISPARMGQLIWLRACFQPNQ